MQLIDCQNVFCELSKYARVAHPDIEGISRRTRIKQKYTPASGQVPQWYPPKWGINGAVIASARSGLASEQAARKGPPAQQSFADRLFRPTSAG
jgi:hypothetical protein